MHLYRNNVCDDRFNPPNHFNYEGYVVPAKFTNVLGVNCLLFYKHCQLAVATIIILFKFQRSQSLHDHGFDFFNKSISESDRDELYTPLNSWIRQREKCRRSQYV